MYNAQTRMLNFFAYDSGNLKIAQIGTGDYADRSKVSTDDLGFNSSADNGAVAVLEWARLDVRPAGSRG